MAATPAACGGLTKSWPVTEPADLLRRIQGEAPGVERSELLQDLVARVKSGEVRDYAFTPELYQELFGLLGLALTWRAKELQDDVCKAEQIFLGFTRVPEFDAEAAEPHLEGHLLRAMVSRADGQGTQDEWPYIRDVLLWAYGRFPAKRAQLRALLGRTLQSASRFMHKSAPIGPLLEMLLPVIRGFGQLGPVHRSLLFDILMPLHRSNEWLAWDRQTPLIGLYHKELVQCMLLLLEKQPSLAVRCLEMICTHFPQLREANTPKEVLLIHEIAQVLKYADTSAFQQVLPLLLQHMRRFLHSHNAQPIQSVLQFWKDEKLVDLFQASSDEVIPALLPALLRGGEPFWNPTVNRMTSLVLEKLAASNPECFRQAAEDLWGPGRQLPAYVAAATEAASAQAAAAQVDASPTGAPASPGVDVHSLKSCLGGWRPPAAGSQGGSQGAPPLTATGVAPWALGATRGGANAKQPPLTATGVAPWAFNGGTSHGASGLALGRGATTAPRNSSAPLKVCKEKEEEAEAPEQELSGIDRVHEYMKMLCPDGAAQAAGATSWEAALMAETPTLLPCLKFHQLVFGAEDLAAGAFSVVRYARTIVKDKTQSQWPEYAVKVINTKTIQEHGYEACVNREICVLKMLSHPGIARMVSAFRWRDGAYLVLEYAARGDLHSILVQQGKLSEDTARFLLGEVIAALTAIHEIGFVYGDLKPENIVLTSSCHAKLTDFGGCRPLTPEARQRTQQSLLQRLRDGDWRAKDDSGEVVDNLAEVDIAAAADDGRVEGTTMYLPPEVVRGAAPTLAADAWAMGCLEYQLLTGRPPIWVESESEEDLKSRIVSFQLDDGQTSLEPLSERARGLAKRLLETEVAKRLSVQGAASDAFFEGMDVFTLYNKPRGPDIAFANRSATPAGDARWQKRQFSKIWTVMPSPQDYQLPPASAAAVGHGLAAMDFLETAAEANAAFLDEALVDIPVGARSIESL